MKKTISYTAIILNETSKRKLFNFIKPAIPKEWGVYLHHMTICLGEMKNTFPHLTNDIGKNIKLNIVGIGVSEKAIAFEVEGYESDRKRKHITIAINKNKGGKPKDSNDIKIWRDIKSFNLTCEGIVKEIPFK